MKNFFEKRKRDIAAILVVVLALQTILISGPLSLTTVHAGVKNRVDLTTGEPGAFRELYVETGTVVSGDGDKLSMRFGFGLSDEWLEGKLYEYIDAGILIDPGDFESLQAYDAYLDGVEDERFVPLAFTCTVNDGVLDVPQIQEYLEGNREIYTVRNEKIGTWEVENSAKGPVFTIIFDKKVYSRSNVVGNRGFEAQLLERFQQGDTVESGKGSGGVDLSIHINGTGEPVATSSDYVMEKTEESGDETRNADGETDPSAINFEVSVRANASNAKNPLAASASNWLALASPDGAARSVASGSEPDDGIPLDERDGELTFDWWNFSAPVKSRYVRPADDGDPGFDLSGKFVIDSISPDLNLDAVEISINGSAWERLAAREVVGHESWEEYLTDNDRLFSYRIPSAEAGTVAQFNIRFYTRIADSLWAEYGKYGVLEREFPNKAILKGEDGTTTLTVSNQVKPSVYWESLIEKTGTPLDVNGDMYQWEIHVDAHFSAGVNLYLVDHIKDSENTHQYMLDDPENHPVWIESAGKSRKTFDVVKLSAEELGSIEEEKFEALSINDIEQLLGGRFNDGTVYVYEQTDTTNGGTDQFMLIPMTGYTNGKSTIYYETDFRASKDQSSLGYEVELSNEVKPVWKWDLDLGLGPGDMPFGEITVGKTYPVQVNVVNKKAAEYHPESNSISWEFDVNQRGVKLDRVLIMGDLDAGQKLEWLGLGEGKEISLIHTDRRPAAQRSSAGDRRVSYVTPETWNQSVDEENADTDALGDYYTIDGAELKIRLDEMGAEDYYKFTVNTRILDGNYAQDGKWTIENTASVVATSNGKTSKLKEIKAETEIEHNLISKYVEPFGKETGKPYFYNFKENSVQWRIKVNPSGSTVKNRVKHGSVEVSKRIMVLKDLGQADGTYEYAEASGFTFSLSGNPAHDPAKDSAPAGQKTWMATTGEDGTLVFETVPVGTYKLEELDVPEMYKDANDNWLIDRAPAAWVVIEPVAESAAEDGVTVRYYSVSADGKQGEELEERKAGTVSQDAPGIYLQPDAPASGVEVYNTLKLANIQGTKLAVSGKQTASLQTAPLPDAEFTLTHSTLAREGNAYTYRAKTDENGTLSFTHVPYGTYTLNETGVPAGFEKMSALEITLSDESLDAANGTYWLKDAGGDTLLRNQVAVVNARFQKLDQNGDKIPNSKLDAQFAVEKIHKAVAGEDFWPEGAATVPTDENGYLELNNLSCGVYRVQETLTDAEREKLDSGSALAEFWLEVKAAPETGKAEVCVYGEKPSADGLSSFLNSLLRINSPLAAITVSVGETADFTDAALFEKVAHRMTNVWKYGGIQLHKVGGDAAGESGHEVTSDLEGVTFKIYKKGENVPYLTLKTVGQGRLPGMDSDGKYKDAETGERKVILAGEYTLKESSAREGYQTYTEPIDFTVTDRSKTIFFGYDGVTVSAEPLDAAAGKDIKFYNIPERGKLEFIKKDSETKKALDGAVFLAFTNEAQTEPIAFVGQMAAGGKYEIIGNREQISVLKNKYRDEIAGWNDRIDGVAAVSGNDQDGYALKTGDYYLKEIEAPENYSLPAVSANSIKVTVKAGQTVQVQAGMVDGDVEDGVVANTVAKANIAFTKKIETSDYRPDDVPAGIRFVLRGTSANWEASAGWMSDAVSRADGGFSFADVPAGVYVLYECDRDSDTNTDPYMGFRPGVEDEVAILRVLVEAEGGSAKVTCTKMDDSPVDFNESGMEITNKLKSGSIAGKKVSAGNQPVDLKGAVFGIFRSREDAIQGSNPVETVQSGVDGGFLFENVPYGIYYIKEQEAPYGYVPVTTVYKVEIRDAGLEAVKQGIDVETDEASADMKDIVFVNENKRGTILLEKKASLTGAVLPDAVFTVYASYTDGILEVPAAYLTYQDGVYKLSDGDGLIGQPPGQVPYLQKDEHGAYNLLQGHYWVAETKVPDGYRKEMDGGAQKVYPVTISGDSAEQQIPVVVITNDTGETAFYNELMTGSFTIQKSVETAGPGDGKPGVSQAGKGFKFRIEGITTETASKGTPVSQIGTLRIDGAEAGDAENAEVDGDTILVTTGAEGTVEVSGLPIGRYTVTETDGPEMELYTAMAPKKVVISQNDSQTELEITFDGKKADTRDAILSFHNELKRYRAEGKKVDDKGEALAGAVFGLYSEDGQRLYRTAEADKNGIFAFEDLPTGMYMVKEITPPGEGYLVDNTEYPIAVTTEMDPADTIKVSDFPIVNVLIRGAIEGQKVTSGDKPLPGAVIGLFPADTANFTEENLFYGMRAVSDADGKFLFENVPYGVYRVAELQAPSGYNLNSQTSYLVKVETHGTVVTAGIWEEKGAAAAADVTAIRIENKRKSSGSSGSINHNPKPVDPAAAGLGPGMPPTEPSGLIPSAAEPMGEAQSKIPFDPSHPVISIPGDPPRVEIVDENGIQVYEGSGRDIYIGDWEPGNYKVYTFDDQDVPLGTMVFTINEEDAPLAFMLPKTGDSSLPYALLAAAIMLGAAGGIGVLTYRGKKRQKK